MNPICLYHYSVVNVKKLKTFACINVFQWKYPMKINSYVKTYLNLFECLSVHQKIFGAGKIARLSATQFLNKSQLS